MLQQRVEILRVQPQFLPSEYHSYTIKTQIKTQSNHMKTSLMLHSSDGCTDRYLGEK